MNQTNESTTATKTKRGKNVSFFHYTLRKIQDNGGLGALEYYKTHSEITAKYGLSRATLYRICKNPSCKSRYKLFIEKDIIHTSIVNHI